MVGSQRFARLTDICLCRNLICAIVSGVLGVGIAITGGIIVGVGFGTLPKDIWDRSNMAKRVAGMVMVGAGVVLINIAVLSIVFFMKRSKFDKPKTQATYNVKSRNFVRGGGTSRNGAGMAEMKVPLDDSFGTGGGAQIYKGGGVEPLLATPGGDNDSVFKYNTSMKQDDSSFSSIPIPMNRSITSHQSESRMEAGLVSKAPPTHSKNMNPPTYNNLTPSPRPPPSTDLSGQGKKTPSTTSSAATSRETKPAVTRTAGSHYAASDDSEEPLPPSQSSRPRASKPSVAVVAPSVHGSDDVIVGQVSVTVKPVAKKKKKAGKDVSGVPAPGEMYGGLAEGEEPIPPRVGRIGRDGTATPETILVSSDIEEEYDPEEELAPPPVSSHRSNHGRHHRR